jgi:hypothetical protein
LITATTVANLLGAEDDDAFAYNSMVTVPAAPSTRTVAPSGMRAVPFCLPTTAGMAYSRAQIVECDRIRHHPRPAIVRRKLASTPQRFWPGQHG